MSVLDFQAARAQRERRKQVDHLYDHFAELLQLMSQVEKERLFAEMESGCDEQRFVELLMPATVRLAIRNASMGRV